MREEMDSGVEVGRKYCFTEKEFLLLAGSLGIKEMYGFLLEDTEGMEERELHEMLFGMTKKRFLEVEESGYKVTPDIRQLFENIVKAVHVIIVAAADNRFPMKCIYPAEFITEIESGGLNGGFLKVRAGTAKNLMRNIVEENLTLEQMIEDDMLYQKEPLEESDEESLLKGKLEVLWGKERRELAEELEPEGIRTVVEKWEAGTRLLEQRLLLLEQPLYDIIAVQNKEKVQLFRYSRQRMLEIMIEMTGGESL